MTNFNFEYIYPLLIIGTLFLVYLILKIPHPIIHSLKNSFWGCLWLILINLAQPYTNIKIPINWITLGVSAFLGLPGMGSMAILNSMFCN